MVWPNLSNRTVCYGLWYNCLSQCHLIGMYRACAVNMVSEVKWMSAMMIFNLPRPEPMVCTGNVAMNWKQFWEAFDDYSIATQLPEKSTEIQAATLKTIMDKEHRQTLSHLQLTEVEKKSTKDILDKSEAYFVPTCNILCQTKTAWGCKKGCCQVK